MLLHYQTKHGNGKIALYDALPEFNQSLLDFFNITDLQLTLSRDGMTPESKCNQLTVGGHGSGEMSLRVREFCAVIAELYCAYGALVRCAAERNVISNEFDNS